MGSRRGYPAQVHGHDLFLKRLRQVSTAYLNWLHDPEVIRYLQVRFEPRDRASVERYVKSFDHINRFLFGIYVAATGQHIGNISLRVNPHHLFAHMGYMIGEKAYWGTPAAIDACRLLFDFAFDVRGVRKIFECTTGDHIGSQTNFIRLGFTREAMIPSLYWSEKGTYVGATYWTLDAQQWRDHCARKTA